MTHVDLGDRMVRTFQKFVDIPLNSSDIHKSFDSADLDDTNSKLVH